MALPSMRRFGPIFRSVPGAGVQRANSISTGSLEWLVVSRENRLDLFALCICAWKMYRISSCEMLT